jgi:hypothetical protein
LNETLFIPSKLPNKKGGISWIGGCGDPFPPLIANTSLATKRRTTNTMILFLADTLILALLMYF